MDGLSQWARANLRKIFGELKFGFPYSNEGVYTDVDKDSARRVFEGKKGAYA
jgi:hypothetical protein